MFSSVACIAVYLVRQNFIPTSAPDSCFQGSHLTRHVGRLELLCATRADPTGEDVGSLIDVAYGQSRHSPSPLDDQSAARTRGQGFSWMESARSEKGVELKEVH